MRCALLLALLGVGCGDGHDHGTGTAVDAAGDGHSAPPGATGVAVGQHFAHLAIWLDGDDGTLQVMVYDGHFESPVRIAAETIAITVTPAAGAPFDVACAAQADALSGETVGDTSVFRGAHEGLRGLARFQGRIARLTILGQAATDLAFPFPEGVE